LEKIMRI